MTAILDLLVILYITIYCTAMATISVDDDHPVSLALIILDQLHIVFILLSVFFRRFTNFEDEELRAVLPRDRTLFVLACLLGLTALILVSTRLP